MRYIPLILAYALNIIDYLFTRHWVKLYGLDIEGNPIGRWMFENDSAGVVKIFVVGVAFLVLGCLIGRHPSLRWTGFIPLAVYSAIVVYHICLWVYITSLK